MQVRPSPSSLPPGARRPTRRPGWGGAGWAAVRTGTSLGLTPSPAEWGLGSDLELPLPRIGASHKGWGGQWWRKGLHWPLSSQGGSLFPHRVENASLE